MIFYHASKSGFAKPDPSFFRDEKDFGPRLYCSDTVESAKQYCDSRNCSFIMTFDFDLQRAADYGLSVRYFDIDNMTTEDIGDWIREIVINRAPDAAIEGLGEYGYLPEDIIIGPRADDDIDEIITSMISDGISILDDYQIERYFEDFKPRKYTTQYCFIGDACDIIFSNMDMDIHRYPGDI